MVRALLANLFGIGAATDVLADSSGLLLALDESNFWIEEDYDTKDSLRDEIERDGVVALFGSKRMVFLDSEQLAEDGILDVLLEIGPHLRQRGITIDDMRALESDGLTYVVEVNGKSYTVYTPDEVEDSWMLALETFVRIINDLRPQKMTDWFYAIGGGNDGSGMFLPEEIVVVHNGGSIACQHETIFVSQKPADMLKVFGVGIENMDTNHVLEGLDDNRLAGAILDGEDVLLLIHNFVINSVLVAHCEGHGGVTDGVEHVVSEGSNFQDIVSHLDCSSLNER